MFYQVLRRDELGFWQALPGNTVHVQLYKAIQSAEAYHEITEIETEVVTRESKVVWNSSIDMHRIKP